MEMSALESRPHQNVQSHGSSAEDIRRLHERPDYFWIVDADEFYDEATIPAIISRLTLRRPRGMRVRGYNYVGTWNRRVPAEVIDFCQFGFLRFGTRIKFIRRVTWNETRLSRVLTKLHLPDVSSQWFGFDVCPLEVGFFHHGCWLGDRSRLESKVAKSAHPETNTTDYQLSVLSLRTDLIPTAQMPQSLRALPWPAGFWESEC